MLRADENPWTCLSSRFLTSPNLFQKLNQHAANILEVVFYLPVVHRLSYSFSATAIASLSEEQLDRSRHSAVV
jgi:hypothetical protein